MDEFSDLEKNVNNKAQQIEIDQINISSIIEPPPQFFGGGNQRIFYFLVPLLCEKLDYDHKCTGVAPTMLSQCISWSHWVSKWSTMCKPKQCVW